MHMLGKIASLSLVRGIITVVVIQWGREDVNFLKNIQLQFENLGEAKSDLSFLFCYSRS